MFVLFCVFILFSSEKSDYTDIDNKPPTSREIIDQMIKSIDNVKTLKYKLGISERIKGKLTNASSLIKYQKSPRKLHLYLNGPELLWLEGKNNGNALVSPGSFPYFDLNLDPYGAILRKNQHHTLHEIGYDYLSDLIQSFILRADGNFEQTFLYIGEDKFENSTCYKIIIKYSDFAFSSYKVKKGENIVSIARKLKVSEYMILENNPAHEGYYAVKAGDVLSVPNAYAKMTVLLIDKELMLPVNTKMYDDKGLFESYEYRDLKVNIVIPDVEFSKNFKEYHF